MHAQLAVQPESLRIDFRAIREREGCILKAGKALNTRRAYASAWRSWQSWCSAAALDPLPTSARAVQDFVTWCLIEGYRLQTVTLRVSAIVHYHREAGHQNPCDDELREYIVKARRELKETPGGKTAVTYDLLRKIASHLHASNPVSIRNRAMILLAFASGWRRSEVVALRYSEVRFVRQGLELWQRSSKTDQAGKGRLVGIEAGRRALTCPVRALEAWLNIRGKWQGPLFTRCAPGTLEPTRKALEPRGEVLHHALKRAIAAVGEDARNFGAHSLRSGMVTEAARSGANETAIRLRTGHTSSRTLQKYIRPANVFEFNPLRGVL